MNSAPTRRKTECSLSRQEFRAAAKPLTVSLEGMGTHVAEAKEFSTGSLGWYSGGKARIEITTPEGLKKMVTVQIGLNLTIVGSKELPSS